MSRFNTKSAGTKTVNLAGGEAYRQSSELELVSILLTSFMNDQFYESSNDTTGRLVDLIEKCDKKFAAQAAVYARTRFGMRSVSHVVASELAKHIGGKPWAKDFYTAIVYRPDDMMEILSYHDKNGKIPNSMKKGFAKAFDKFDRYQLAKYRGEGKGYKLVDVVNLVHPVPTERNGEAISELVNGSLKSFDTWESELTRAGQEAESEKQKASLKKEVWRKLISEKKIGYFALLRNLRNIIEQAPDMVPRAIEILTDESLIKKSLVLPFRFTTAFDEIEKMNSGPVVRDVMVALSKAVDLSLSNVPRFDGRTLVVLDTSGSMTGKPSTIGSLFAAILVKSNNADLMTFDSDSRYVNVNPVDSTVTIANELRFNGGGTNFKSIFKKANRAYDRVIILSDMQGWMGWYSPSSEFGEYKKKMKVNPRVYSFDLAGYGTLQFPEHNVSCLTGFSDKIFDIMKLLEQDEAALVNEIKKVSF